MKGLLQWFKASSKMKRWMLLILVGIVLTCYGIAEVLVLKEMSFDKVGKIIVTFIIGFVAIILGLVFLNKRTLEVLVESTDDRMENKKNVNVKSLIFNKTVYDQGPNSCNWWWNRIKHCIIWSKKLYKQYYSYSYCFRLWRNTNIIKKRT